MFKLAERLNPAFIVIENVPGLALDKSFKEEEIRDNVYAKVAFHNDLTKEKNGLTIWDSKDAQLSAQNLLELMEIIPADIMKIIMETTKGKSNRKIAEEKGIKKEEFQKDWNNTARELLTMMVPVTAP